MAREHAADRTEDQHENVLVYWPVLCYDRRKEHPFPLQTRFLVLDESQITRQQKAEILNLVRGRKAPSPKPAPEGVGEVITMSSTLPRGEREILKYRHLFKEVSKEGLGELWQEREKRPGPFSMEPVTLMPDYVEDENGSEITKTQMFDHHAGEPVIIMGVPESVTRLGPAGAKNKDAWSVDVANTIAHFMQVTEQIGKSRWIREPVMVSSAQGKGIIDSAFPSPESALSILVLFRQLCSSGSLDDLFNRACRSYLRHVDHQGKESYVRAEKDRFNDLLRKPPGFCGNAVPFPLQEVLEGFLYGARVMHARAKAEKTVADLRRMLEKTDREMLVMGLHSGMRELFGCAAIVYPVVRQDFAHWVGDLGLAKPDLIEIRKLLAGRSLSGDRRP